MLVWPRINFQENAQNIVVRTLNFHRISHLSQISKHTYYNISSYLQRIIKYSFDKLVWIIQFKVFN